MSVVDDLLENVHIPPMAPVRQKFPCSRVEDVEGEVVRLLAAKNILASINSGDSVAITAGSRGIANLPLVIRTVVRAVRAVKGEPFIFPAMGSHGGASAEGQVKLLAGLGITEESVEAPIRSSMETALLGHTDDGVECHLDAYADKADAIILINRIKPHTSFRGEVESGLQKMITIGMGKQKGAENCHKDGFSSVINNVPAIAKVILTKKNILCGVALLENSLHETAVVDVLTAEEILTKEPELLKQAWGLLPQLYCTELDVLVMDELGKDISGTGFDTNVVGRYATDQASGGPNISRVVALSLTAKTKGNGHGVGMLDCITTRVFDAFDMEQSYPNALTTTTMINAKLPMALANDKQAIQAAIKTCTPPDSKALRIIRIKNTLELETVLVSEALLPYCEKHPNLEVLGPAEALVFDANGNLF